MDECVLGGFVIKITGRGDGGVHSGPVSKLVFDIFIKILQCMLHQYPLYFS